MSDIFSFLDQLTAEFRPKGPRVWVAESVNICAYHARLTPKRIADGVREVGSFNWSDAARFPTANSCRRWIAERGLETMFQPTGYEQKDIPAS